MERHYPTITLTRWLLVFKLTLLFIYGVIGVVGWYNYFNISFQHSLHHTDKLSPSMTLAYVRSTVWYHSRGKLQELRSILLNDDLTNRPQIEIRISNMLKHRTMAYILDFNALNTPIENLGDWYVKQFDFNHFLLSVYDTVFSSLSVESKLQLITDTMEFYQNETNTILSQALNKEKK